MLELRIFEEYFKLSFDTSSQWIKIMFSLM
jgi:hypothetical protein